MYYAIGIKIDDEDKGIIENGKINSFKLADGPHKIVLTSFAQKTEVVVPNQVYPAIILNFKKDTIVGIKLRFNNSNLLEFVS